MNHSADPLATLEAGQLASMRMRKLPRRTLGRGTLWLLVLMRIYVVLALPVVGYAFVHALLVQQP